MAYTDETPDATFETSLSGAAAVRAGKRARLCAKMRSIKTYGDLGSLTKAERVELIGAVYLVKNDNDGSCKIGHSLTPRKRLSGLQTATTNVLRLAYFVAAARPSEAAFHWLFRVRRIRGEWFRDDDGVIERVFKAIDESNCQFSSHDIRALWSVIRPMVATAAAGSA